MFGDRLIVLVAHVAMALLFVVTGLLKVLHPERLGATLHALGLPKMLAIGIGVFEVAAGLAFIAAFRLRMLGPVLAAWCIFTGLVGHPFWSDPSQLSSFLKNVGLAGAFLVFSRNGIDAGRPRV